MRVLSLRVAIISNGPPFELSITGRVRLWDLCLKKAGDGVGLTAWNTCVCAAPEPNCLLLADWLKGLVVRVSLETQQIEECITRLVRSDERVNAVQLLPGAIARVALLLSQRAENPLTAVETRRRRTVRLLARQSNTWRVICEWTFYTTENKRSAIDGLCISGKFLLCALLHYSRRLVAVEFTSDSKLLPAGEVQFDSNINGVCAFASGAEQLVATTHADNTAPVEAIAASHECNKIFHIRVGGVLSRPF